MDLSDSAYIVISSDDDEQHDPSNDRTEGDLRDFEPFEEYGLSPEIQRGAIELFKKLRQELRYHLRARDTAGGTPALPAISCFLACGMLESDEVPKEKAQKWALEANVTPEVFDSLLITAQSLLEDPSPSSPRKSRRVLRTQPPLPQKPKFRSAGRRATWPDLVEAKPPRTIYSYQISDANSMEPPTALFRELCTEYGEDFSRFLPHLHAMWAYFQHWYNRRQVLSTPSQVANMAPYVVFWLVLSRQPEKQLRKGIYLKRPDLQARYRLNPGHFKMLQGILENLSSEYLGALEREGGGVLITQDFVSKPTQSRPSREQAPSPDIPSAKRRKVVRFASILDTYRRVSPSPPIITPHKDISLSEGAAPSSAERTEPVESSAPVTVVAGVEIIDIEEVELDEFLARMEAERSQPGSAVPLPPQDELPPPADIGLNNGTEQDLWERRLEAARKARRELEGKLQAGNEGLGKLADSFRAAQAKYERVKKRWEARIESSEKKMHELDGYEKAFEEKLRQLRAAVPLE